MVKYFSLQLWKQSCRHIYAWIYFGCHKEIFFCSTLQCNLQDQQLDVGFGSLLQFYNCGDKVLVFYTRNQKQVPSGQSVNCLVRNHPGCYVIILLLGSKMLHFKTGGGYLLAQLQHDMGEGPKDHVIYEQLLIQIFFA